MQSTLSAKLFSVLSFIVVFAVFMIAILLWQSFQRIHQVTDQVAISNATNMLTSLARYRDFYTDFVVPRGKIAGVAFSHVYQQNQEALPLPAAFMKSFADQVTNISPDAGVRVRFVSDMPFVWRVGKDVELDGFEQEAMKQARLSPEQDFWRIEEVEGKRVLRIARPDRLIKQACVDCHNSYEGTPKTDWKLGDVRGIFSLSFPLDGEDNAIRENYLSNFLWLAVSIVALLLLLSWSLLQLRNALRTAEKNNQGLVENNKLIEDQVMRAEHLNALLSAEQNKLESVFSAVSDMIVVIDDYGIIHNVNQSAIDLLGFSANELVGKSVNMLMPSSVAQHHDGYLQRYWSRPMRSTLALAPRRVSAQTKQGELIEVELEVRSVHLGDQLLFVGVLRDIRARLEMEQSLKNARDEAINTANLKSQFLANMSHELRTPLNGMISMSQLLEEDLKTPVLKDRAKVISTSAKHLLSIVNDILDFSRIQSGKFELYPKPFDVETWLVDSLAIHLQVAKDKQLGLSLTIQQGVPKTLLGDTLRLSQILHNLLSNALKFTTQGGVFIELSLAGFEEKDGQQFANIHFSVRDTGMGMSQNALQHLFQPFSQVDNSASRVHGGTGLGLMISCELSQMMQGGITVASTLGEGSVFTVMVALATVDDQRLEQMLFDIGTLDKFAHSHQSSVVSDGEESHDPELHQPDDFSTFRLLVVEDNPVNQKVVAALLKRFGYEFELAGHGEEALEKLSHTAYDLILMDCQMPILDGYETTRKLRHRELGGKTHIPVIALTAHAMEGEDQKCYAAGMDDYITKPLDHALLKEKIAFWLAKRQLT